MTSGNSDFLTLNGPVPTYQLPPIPDGGVLTAFDRTGARIEATNDDQYIAACRLAVLLGVDLEG